MLRNERRIAARPTILPFYSELAEPRHETQPLPAWDVRAYIAVLHVRLCMHIRRIYPAVNSKYVREVHSDELSRRTQFRRRFLFVRATKPTWLGKRREFRPYTKYFHIPFATAAPFSSSRPFSLSLAANASRPFPRADVALLSRTTADTKGYWDL
ncbi:hypothetical protein PUN28_010537 [Cardiocondyla obscurior]|uniref:Uncharacterized protein n=1 Tax=Cardiocondyla obscurior TaxID=286306 RepID=A0AAW2FHX3_9HYME